jgi:gliding motility-associated-like protein
MKNLPLILLCLCFGFYASASHEVGNYISYKNLGNNQYEFTITQIRDCRPPSLGGGNPVAILNDNPLFVSIFTGAGTFVRFDSIQPNTLGGEVIKDIDLNAPCLGNKPEICLSKISFTLVRTLPPNANGYYILSERCCLTGGLNNVANSGGLGLSTITFLQSTIANSSAEFQRNVPQLLCLSNTNTLDFSADDRDGDSLSYSFCEIYSGASQVDPKPIVTSLSLPSTPIPFSAGYGAQNPLNITNPNDFSLNAQTGILTVRPNLQGRFIMGICCTEWRNGVAIQENFRTAVVQVINCSGSLDVNASLDQVTPFDCPVKLSVEGAFSYNWSIRDRNAPSQNTIYLDNDSVQNPSVLFRQNSSKRTGEFIISVIGSDSTNSCFGQDSLKLTVTDKDYFFIPNAFSPNGDGRNDELSILTSGVDFEYIRIFNRWGNKVFESNSLNNKWDGTYKGSEAAADSFFWVARYRDKAKNRITKKGTVTIIR